VVEDLGGWRVSTTPSDHQQGVGARGVEQAQAGCVRATFGQVVTQHPEEDVLSHRRQGFTKKSTSQGKRQQPEIGASSSWPPGQAIFSVRLPAHQQIGGHRPPPARFSRRRKQLKEGIRPTGEKKAPGKQPQPAQASRFRDLIPATQAGSRSTPSQPCSAGRSETNSGFSAGPPWVGLADRAQKLQHGRFRSILPCSISIPLPAAGPAFPCMNPAAPTCTSLLSAALASICDFAGGPLGDKPTAPTPNSIAAYLPLLATGRSAVPIRAAPLPCNLGGGTPSLLTPEQIGACSAAWLQVRPCFARCGDQHGNGPASFDQRRSPAFWPPAGVQPRSA